MSFTQSIRETNAPCQLSNAVTVVNKYNLVLIYLFVTAYFSRERKENPIDRSESKTG